MIVTITAKTASEYLVSRSSVCFVSRMTPPGVTIYMSELTSTTADPAGGLLLALEVIPLAVSDIERALAFYAELGGLTLDVEYRPTAEFRVVQLTPPGSACSVQLVIADSPDRVHNLYLVTPDLGAARATSS